MSASTNLKKQIDLSDVLTPDIQNRARARERNSVKVEDSRFANIAENTFHKIMFDTATSPEDKKNAVAKALTYAGTKEENRERVKEYTLFCEYLQSVREEMSTEIIRLTDTNAFSELQKTYDDLNNALIEFDEMLKPLTDILEAIYTLRTQGETMNAFAEIRNEKKREEDINQKRQLIDSDFNAQKMIRFIIV